MESNIEHQEYFDNGSPLDEPHFDEEATLLLARPVVPLQEIKADERSRKRLVIGVAMICSLGLGALAATLIYKQREEEPSIVVVSKAAPGAAGIAFDEPVAAITQRVEGAATGIAPETDTQTPMPTKPLPSPSRRAALVETKRKTPMPPQIEERELTWDERFGERRRRRISERQTLREARRRQRRSSDDLIRIREIFEGPSRP
jgi:hypothetical protein